MSSEAQSPTTQKKYGTFLGVYVPSILTILGVILYLRLGWVVANVGLTSAIVILTFASAITFITGLSTSATATNMKVQGGGVYFMVSRCFGIESGAAIGLPLFLAQAIGITFYTMGFAESVHQLLPMVPTFIISIVSLFSIGALVYYAPELAMKSQLFIFAAILLSVLSFYLGDKLIAPAEALKAFEKSSFWIVFAVFFPAVTGITTGISMSGDLEDPGKSIPIGTLAAVISGFLIYLFTMIFLDRLGPTELLNSDSMIIAKISKLPFLIYIGIWCSTLSSALGGLLAAPRTLQAMAKDGLGPSILARGFGPSDDPRVAMIVTFVLALSINFLGGIDVIAPILTMFFLTSYGALNLAAGLEGLTQNPSWRPSFKTPWTISIAGAAGCLVSMLFIDPQATVVALVFCVVVYFVVRRTHAHKREWSDIRRGLLLHMARTSVYSLAKLTEAARTWRPNIMVLSSKPASQPNLIQISNALTQRRGFLIIASIVHQLDKSRKALSLLEAPIRKSLEKSEIQAIVKVKVADDITESIKNLVSDYGVGVLTPNTIIMGCFDNHKGDNKDAKAMCDIIFSIYKSEKNLLLVRKPDLLPDAKNSRIDVWIGKENSNDALILAFAYLLQTSADWIGSELCLKTFAEDEVEKTKILKNNIEFVKRSRISATNRVYVKEEELSHFEAIQKYSKDAGTVFLGMNPPKEGESIEGYVRYYEALMEKSKDFPEVVFLLKGETIEFEDIFK